MAVCLGCLMEVAPLGGYRWVPQGLVSEAGVVR